MEPYWNSPVQIGKGDRGLKMPNLTAETEDSVFAELRARIRSAEVLSSMIEKLLVKLHFTGRISVVVQNGRVLKSGYEEGYFTRRQEERMIP